jgi:hypothetical protein
MTQVLTLGEWINEKYGDQGVLAAKMKPPVRKNTVSSWVTGRNRIRPKYRKQIEALGFNGPWPQKTGEEGAVSREEFEELQEDVEDAAEVIRFLLTLVPEGSRPAVLPRKYR